LPPCLIPLCNNIPDELAESFKGRISGLNLLRDIIPEELAESINGNHRWRVGLATSTFICSSIPDKLAEAFKGRISGLNPLWNIIPEELAESIIGRKRWRVALTPGLIPSCKSNPDKLAG
jgi:hypothetical protein